MGVKIPFWDPIFLVAPRHPVPQLFGFLDFSGGFPFSPLKVKPLAGDLRAAQFWGLGGPMAV